MSLRNREHLLILLSKCWWVAQTWFSFSKKVSSVTVPGLRHSSSSMARIPVWFWSFKTRALVSVSITFTSMHKKETTLSCLTSATQKHVLQAISKSGQFSCPHPHCQQIFSTCVSERLLLKAEPSNHFLPGNFPSDCRNSSLTASTQFMGQTSIRFILMVKNCSFLIVEEFCHSCRTTSLRSPLIRYKYLLYLKHSVTSC